MKRLSFGGSPPHPPLSVRNRLYLFGCYLKLACVLDGVKSKHSRFLNWLKAFAPGVVAIPTRSAGESSLAHSFFQFRCHGLAWHWLSNLGNLQICKRSHAHFSPVLLFLIVSVFLAVCFATSAAFHPWITLAYDVLQSFKVMQKKII